VPKIRKERRKERKDCSILTAPKKRKKERKERLLYSYRA
jgi:hypothetical protein